MLIEGRDESEGSKVVGASLGDGDGAGDSVGSVVGAGEGGDDGGLVEGATEGLKVAEGPCVSVGVSDGDGEGAGESVGAGEVVGGQSVCTTPLQNVDAAASRKENFTKRIIVETDKKWLPWCSTRVEVSYTFAFVGWSLTIFLR
jgi:hypothetical protein